MATTCVITGSVMGFATILYSNAVRKLPLRREPWMHLSGIVFGGILGYGYHRLDQYEEGRRLVLDELYLKTFHEGSSNPIFVPPQWRSSPEAKETSTL